MIMYGTKIQLRSQFMWKVPLGYTGNPTKTAVSADNEDIRAEVPEPIILAAIAHSEPKSIPNQRHKLL